jgi:hypothetical protein
MQEDRRMSRKSVAQKDSKTPNKTPNRVPKQNGASARSKPRVSPVFHVARLVLINAMAKARVPTEEIAAKLGVNRSYVIRQCVMETQPVNASERAIAKLAAEHEGHFRKLGLHGLLGEGFVTLLAGDPGREDRIRVVRLAGPGGPAKPPKRRMTKATATVKAAKTAAKAAVKAAVKAVKAVKAEAEAKTEATEAKPETKASKASKAAKPKASKAAKPKAAKPKATKTKTTPKEPFVDEFAVERVGDPAGDPALDTTLDTGDEWGDDSELVNAAVPGTGVTAEEILDRAESEG